MTMQFLEEHGIERERFRLSQSGVYEPLTTRFELEDAETLLAGLLTRRNELKTLLASLATQIPAAEAQVAAAQQALAQAEAGRHDTLAGRPLSS